MVQCGEDGVGKIKRGSVAYIVTSGCLTYGGGLESDRVGGRDVGRDGHGGWAEVYGRVEEIIDRCDKISTGEERGERD